MTPGVLAASVVDEQAVEGVHFDVGGALEHLARDVDALRHREERRLLHVDQDRDDDAIEEARAALDDVDVAVGQRIERAGIDGDDAHVLSSRL